MTRREGEPVWFPGDPSATNVGRFMAAEGVGSFEELRARSVAEPEWFWDAVVRFLGVPFAQPYTSVLDSSRGVPWTTWFNGGRLNLAELCLDRHAAADPDGGALVWEGEDGEVRRWTWAELRREADGLAALLAEHGVGEGDRVGIFLPMLPETVAALFGVMKVGAVFLPLFSGYGSPAVVDRLVDAGAKALITADGTVRRGRLVDMVSVAAQAAALVPTLETVVVVPRLRRLGVDGSVGATPEGALPWPAPAIEPFPTRMVDSEHTLFIAYTSGTTGRPKGTVAVHAGFGVKVAAEAAFQFDLTPADTLFWLTDMGWIMGPWEVVATLAVGATVALFDGAPDWPGPDRLWAFLERHRITVVGLSPTFIRSLMPHGDGPVRAHDLSALRALASTGEPWNLDPWFWYFEVVGGGRCPVVNVSGGTEVGACFLTPHPVEPIKPMSLGGPALGMAMDVFDDEGHSVRGRVGELVCTRPWPGMTRGLYKDPERYIETYWSRWPDVWVHGDWASVDADGAWFLHGRSDDTIKLAGKRLGPAEVESALVSHPLVVEAAAVGVPHQVKGEALWCFVVLAAGAEESDRLREELTDVVGERLGRPFRPSAVRFVAALPKTRNAKVLRRAVRAVAMGDDPGDLSSLEDPATLAAIGAAR